MSVGIVIERMGGEPEARVCARMMVESEPWITLRRGFDDAFKLTADPAKEVYVARAGGELAGNIVVNMEGPFAGYIQALVVAPEWRRRGIGGAIAAICGAAGFFGKASRMYFLCVSGFNSRAQQFYARLGYERIGELKDYVIAGESEFLMRKSVGPKDEFKKS